jgi:hypothetical protein
MTWAIVERDSNGVDQLYVTLATTPMQKAGVKHAEYRIRFLSLVDDGSGAASRTLLVTFCESGSRRQLS